MCLVGTVNWFGRMEGYSVLSLEKWNEQVEIGVEEREGSRPTDLTREEGCHCGMLGFACGGEEGAHQRMTLNNSGASQR